MIFLGDASNRNKYNVVVSDAIHPKLPAKKYLDRGVFENELKQVLGEIYAAEDLSGEDIIIIGESPARPALDLFVGAWRSNWLDERDLLLLKPGAVTLERKMVCLT